MKRLFVFLLLLGCIPAFALISPDLDAVIQQKELNDLIPIDIVLREQMDVQTLRSMVDRLPKVQKRVRVAEILRSFSAENDLRRGCHELAVDGVGDPHGGVTFVHRPRRAAANADLGQHDTRRI